MMFPPVLLWSKKPLKAGGFQYHVTLADGSYLVADADGSWRHLDINKDGFYTIAEGKTSIQGDRWDTQISARDLAEIYYNQLRAAEQRSMSS